MFREKAAERGLCLRLSAPKSGLVLRADPQLLSQVVVNLLSNAIKFTEPSGTVRVIAGCRGDGGCSIAVMDDGIGISKADLPRVMEPFVQVESTFNKKNEGTGLGLPLVKKMTELHGGRLRMASELGRGTAVMADFPPARTIAAGVRRSSEDGGRTEPAAGARRSSEDGGRTEPAAGVRRSSADGGRAADTLEAA